MFVTAVHSQISRADFGPLLSALLAALMLLLVSNPSQAQPGDLDQGLPGTIVSKVQQGAGNYWIQLHAVSRGVNLPSLGRIAQHKKRVIHQGQDGVTRVLIGPYQHYPEVRAEQRALQNSGVSMGFLRFTTMTSQYDSIARESARSLPGEVVSVASSDAGEYWVQVSASSKGYLAPAYLKNYPNLLQHRHRDRQGLHRLLIGPYRSFDKAQSLRMAMNRDHGAGTFVRFAASERGMSRVVVEAPAEHPRATPANQSMENHVEHADLAVTDEIRVEESSDETSVTADRDESQDALVATGLDRGVSADIGRGTPLKIGVSLGAAYAADQRLRFYGEDEPDPLSNLFPAWNNGTLARTESNLLSRHFGVHLQKLFNSEWGIAVDYLHERSEMDQQPMRPELLDINHTTTLRYLDGSLASYNAGSTDHLSGLLVRNHLDGVVLFPINNTFTAKMGLSAAHHDLSADLTQLKLDQTLLQSVSHDINTLFIGIMGGLDLNHHLSNSLSVGIDSKLYFYTLHSELSSRQSVNLAGGTTHHVAYREQRNHSYRTKIEPYIEYAFSKHLSTTFATHLDYWDNSVTLDNPACYRNVALSYSAECSQLPSLTTNNVANYGANIRVNYHY